MSVATCITMSVKSSTQRVLLCMSLPTAKDDYNTEYCKLRMKLCWTMGTLLYFSADLVVSVINPTIYEYLFRFFWSAQFEE